MKSESPTICIYCGRRTPAELLNIIEEDKGCDNRYCPRCIDEVRDNIRKLPWNRKAFFS